MLSKLGKITNATRAAFIVAAVSLLSGCKSNDIAACVAQKTDISGEVFIKDNGVALRYLVENGPDHHFDVDYVEFYVFSDQPNSSTYIEKGTRSLVWTGKFYSPRYYEQEHWYDQGADEPQRSIIKAIKQCASRTLPERAANLN